MANAWARCQGVACPDKQACWRYRAPPKRHEASANYWQTRGTTCEFIEPLTSEHWAILMAPAQDDPVQY